MRTAIRHLSEAQLQEMKEEAKTKREQEAKVLVEALCRRPNIGKGLAEANEKYGEYKSYLKNIEFDSKYFLTVLGSVSNCRPNSEKFGLILLNLSI